jgi:ribosome biogenesis GTPase
VRGQIITRSGDRLLVEIRDKILRCAQRKKLPPLTVGDWVTVEQDSASTNEGVITELEERSTLLSRPDPFNQRRKPIASNIDQLLLVTASEPGIDQLQIDRIIVAAEASSIPLSIVINKVDLLSQDQRNSLKDKLKHYQEIGYPLIWISTLMSKDGEDDIEQLKQQLDGRCSVLVGPSGGGKSSIIKTLLPDGAESNKIAVGELARSIKQGKHTTSVSTLYHLNGYSEETSIIDSPGVREFGVWDLDENTIRGGFREFDLYLDQCRFSNCRHLSEPGCAVSKAVDNGEISTNRLESYRGLLEE